MTREEAIKLFRRDIECLSHDKCSECILEEACDPMKTPPDSEYIEAYGMAIEALSAKTGRWIKVSPFVKPYCSECGESCFGLHGFDCVTTDFCPNCGAKMESEDTE